MTIALNVAHLHFIGIGGAGMSALATMMLSKGKRVSGSDIQMTSLTQELERLGARIAYRHAAENVSTDADCVIYTLAVDATNPELAEAKKRGVPLFTYAQFLGAVSAGFKTIAVSGTHGKTSTTGMIARVLTDAGLEPSVIVGGTLRDFGSNFVAGTGPYFIIEACEFERSFLNLHPEIAVITNIDNDHLDYYANLAGIQKAFREFAERVGPDGVLVCDPSDPAVRPILGGLRCRVIDYGVFIQPDLKLQAPGAHMIRNAAAALAIADILRIDANVARDALERYSGVLRRFEHKGKTVGGADVYDDYAHHPTEIRATLRAARERFPDKRIHAIFQPHLFSRTKMLVRDFAASFGDADEVIFTPIYAAREAPNPDISSDMLARETRMHHPNVSALRDINELCGHFAKSDASDVIFTMGAGDIDRVTGLLVGPDPERVQ